MKVNTRALIGIGMGALALAWISVANHGSRSHDIALTEISDASAAGVASVTAHSPSAKGTRTIASVQPLIVADPQRAVPKGSGLLAEATREELLDVATLGRKAFLTDVEKLRRQSLMRDSVFLRDIAGLLRSRLIDQETLREQYQAIDFCWRRARVVMRAKRRIFCAASSPIRRSRMFQFRRPSAKTSPASRRKCFTSGPRVSPTSRARFRKIFRDPRARRSGTTFATNSLATSPSQTRWMRSDARCEIRRGDLMPTENRCQHRREAGPKNGPAFASHVVSTV